MAAGMAPNFLTSEFLHQGEYGFVLGSEEQPQQYLQEILKTIVLDHSYDLIFSGGCCLATLSCHRIHFGFISAKTWDEEKMWNSQNMVSHYIF